MLSDTYLPLILTHKYRSEITKRLHFLHSSCLYFLWYCLAFGTPDKYVLAPQKVGWKNKEQLTDSISKRRQSHIGNEVVGNGGGVYTNLRIHHPFSFFAIVLLKHHDSQTLVQKPGSQQTLFCHLTAESLVLEEFVQGEVKVSRSKETKIFNHYKRNKKGTLAFLILHLIF